MNRKITTLVLTAGAAAALAAIPALAGPPSLILTGQLAGDLTADGRTVVASVFDANVGEMIVYTYTPGVGPVRSGAIQDNGSTLCSGDGSIVTFDAYDLENVAGWGTDRLTPHLWRPGLGTVTNLGKPLWGAQCDAFSTTILDIARDGHYACGGGYTQAQCGPFRAQRYDIQANTWEILPVSITPPPINAPARATHSWGISADGTVIVGYDENWDSAFTQQWRGSAVWVKNGGTWTQTVLDRYYYGVKGVSADGNTLVGFMSTQTMQATFGTSQQYPIRWTRSGSNWVPSILGTDASMRPTKVSADGSTIVGSGGGSSGFIWRASINGGVPMSLSAYVASLGGSFPNLIFASGIGSPIFSLSDDGNTLVVSTQVTNNCLTWFPGAILALNGAPCEPANIMLPPVSHFNTLGPTDEPGGMVFNCLTTGSWSMTWQWQKETFPGSGVWNNLANDHCPSNNPANFNYNGVTGMQLRIGALSGTWAGRYRCVVTNSCGSTTSAPFRVATCPADYNCDGFVDGIDYDEFNNDFEAGAERADFNGDGFVDGIDYDTFNNAFEAGC